MTTRIAIMVEGATESAFKQPLIAFLARRLSGRMPKLTFLREDGRIPKEGKLKRKVELLLRDNDAVIALTDVYTGTSDFESASHAKALMKSWVGDVEKFIPHVALHDFEAWLLPYWPEIQRLAGSNRSPPSDRPETVNHGNPPAHLLHELFLRGSKGKAYVKPRDATRILRDKDLAIAANACPELKEFLNTILTLSGGDPL